MNWKYYVIIACLLVIGAAVVASLSAPELSYEVTPADSVSKALLLSKSPNREKVEVLRIKITNDYFLSTTLVFKQFTVCLYPIPEEPQTTSYGTRISYQQYTKMSCTPSISRSNQAIGPGETYECRYTVQNTNAAYKDDFSEIIVLENRSYDCYDLADGVPPEALRVRLV